MFPCMSLLRIPSCAHSEQLVCLKKYVEAAGFDFESSTGCLAVRKRNWPSGQIVSNAIQSPDPDFQNGVGYSIADLTLVLF